VKKEVEEVKPKKIRKKIIFLFALLIVIILVGYRDIHIIKYCTNVSILIEEYIPQEEFDVRAELYSLEQFELAGYYYYVCVIEKKSIIETSKYYYKKLKLKLGENIKKEKIATLDITDKIKMSNWDIKSRNIIKKDSEFIVVLGGENNEVGLSVKQTKDGEYFVVGTTNSYGEGLHDGFVGKFNNSGELIWAKTVGGEGDDYIHSIELIDDGGYTVAGYTTSYGSGEYDILWHNRDFVRLFLLQKLFN